MTNNAMWDIGFFQIDNILLRQPDGQRANSFFQMGNLRCPDDRRYYWFLLQQPGKRNVNTWNSISSRNFGDSLHNPLISFEV